MTRAINVRASEAEVTVLCCSQGAIISAIETLVSGGTRVVLSNMEATEKMRGVLGRKVIAGDVQRACLRNRARY